MGYVGWLVAAVLLVVALWLAWRYSDANKIAERNAKRAEVYSYRLMLLKRGDLIEVRVPEGDLSFFVKKGMPHAYAETILDQGLYGTEHEQVVGEQQRTVYVLELSKELLMEAREEYRDKADLVSIKLVSASTT